MIHTAHALTTTNVRGPKVNRASAQKAAAAPFANAQEEYAKSRAKDVENAMSDANIQRALNGDENALFKVGRMTFDSRLPSKFRNYIDAKTLARIDKLRSNQVFAKEYHDHMNQPVDNPTGVFWGEVWHGSIEAFKELGVGVSKIPGQLYNVGKNIVTNPVGFVTNLCHSVGTACSDFGKNWQTKGALTAFVEGGKGLEKTFLGISNLAEESSTMQRMRQERDEAVKDLETETQRYQRLKAANLLTGADIQRYKAAADAARLAKLNYNQEFEKATDVCGETVFKTGTMVLTFVKLPGLSAAAQTRFAAFVAKCPKPIQVAVAFGGRGVAFSSRVFSKVAAPVKDIALVVGAKAIDLIPAGLRTFVADTCSLVAKPFKAAAAKTSGTWTRVATRFTTSKFGAASMRVVGYISDKCAKLADTKNFGAFGKRWFTWDKAENALKEWAGKEPKWGGKLAKVTKGFIAGRVSPVRWATVAIKKAGNALNFTSKVVEGTIRSPFIAANAVKTVPALAAPIYGAAKEEIIRPEIHREAAIGQDMLEKLQKAYPNDWEKIAQRHEAIVDRMYVLHDNKTISDTDFEYFQKQMNTALDKLVSADRGGADAIYGTTDRLLNEDEKYFNGHYQGMELQA